MHRFFLFVVIVIVTGFTGAVSGKVLSEASGSDEKEVYVQKAVREHPDFDWDRTAQSDNFIIFWGGEITGDPADEEQNGDLWFNPEDILAWSEEFYTYVTEEIGFLDPEGENVSKFKFEIVMNETWTGDDFTGWAFGGPADNTTGGVWIHPGGTRDEGVLVHEIGHACQGMVTIDNPGYGIHAPWGGFFWESHTEWLRYVYLEERTPLTAQRYIMTSMMHFSSTRRYYQNFAFLDYVVDEYGFETVNDIWHKANAEEDHPLTSFRDSVMRYSQVALNDDLCRSAMRNVSWDTFMHEVMMKTLDQVPDYDLTRMYTVLDSLHGDEGRFIVPEHLAPGDYGYNIVPLYPDEGATAIEVEFEGLPNEPAGGAGSRYGFVGVDSENNARYSEVFSDRDNQTTFNLMPSDSMVYFVVTGAPEVHHNYEWEVGYPKNYRYPYVVKFNGAVPEGHKEGYNADQSGLSGDYHSNGGGWVSNYANVSSSAYVGPDAQVLKTAEVTGNARIEGFAVVTDNATVKNEAVVRDHALVAGNSKITDRGLVEKAAMAYHTTIQNDATASGSAILKNSTLSDKALAKDLAYLEHKELGGTVIIGGDAEDYNNVSSGIYLDNKRIDEPDGQVIHENNEDVNSDWEEYYYPMGPKPLDPLNLEPGEVSGTSVELIWEASASTGNEMSYFILKKNNDDNLELIDVADDNHYVAEGLEVNKDYCFVVQARTRSGHLSSLSNELTAMTDESSSIRANNALEGIDVFPNPVISHVNVEANLPGDVQLSVYDNLGRQIFQTVFKRTIRIEKSKLGSPGIYTFWFSDGVKKYCEKILVE